VHWKDEPKDCNESTGIGACKDEEKFTEICSKLYLNVQTDEFVYVNNAAQMLLAKDEIEKVNTLAGDSEWFNEPPYEAVSIITVTAGRLTFIFDVLLYPDCVEYLRDVLSGERHLILWHACGNDDAVPKPS
jgi:hypothetical protein